MDREKVVKAWECCNPFNRKCNECPYEKDCYHDGISRHMVSDAIALLKGQETVVRCKDCEHCYFASNRIPSEQNYACGKHGFDVAPDWFCADGERK